MGLRTPLSRVRGLGSAKQGTHHWILQRATAIALVPLTLFFLATMVSMAGMPYETARAFMSQPLITFCFALLIVAGGLLIVWPPAGRVPVQVAPGGWAAMFQL